MSRILIADDERSMLEMLEIVFTEAGCEVVTAPTAELAIAAMQESDIDLVISDMKIPEVGGIGILRYSLEQDKDRPVVMITAYASAESAVEAMKLGAFDYVTKPFNLDELKITVKKGLERQQLIRENRTLRSQLTIAKGFGKMIGNSAAMERVKGMVARVAATDSTILIIGESGTGKELVAHALHNLSDRAKKPFLTINCGAMPENLLESELFGHKKGSFTGATMDKIGLMQAANGGTFFLDEVGEMPLNLQVKLLRAIQEREVTPVGGTKGMKLDIRIIAATNQNLEDAIKDGRFREDLYYRLNVIRIDTPSLRGRQGDIPLLATYFLEKFNKKNERDIKGFAPEVMKLLEAYRYPGNVRELENIVERAVVLGSGESVSLDSLPEQLTAHSIDVADEVLPESGIDLEKKLEGIERGIIAEALARTGGVRKDAARLLGMNQRSLRYKIGKYGL